MDRFLSKYAVTQETSPGRRFPEPDHPYRGAFERDRDRVIHSAAFRRLEGKTQVFTPGINDQYRTRLTHTIEVAQIARTIANVFGLNSDLTEAVCLAHDLGHSPFGHCGETVLNEIMKPFGGFEHNAQSLRIIDLLEKPYPAFQGLNLMYETRLSVARHHTTYDYPREAAFEEPNCPLEGQIADIADRIAYNCHDLEDGMRAKLLHERMFRGLRLYNLAIQRSCAEKIEDPVIRRTRIAKSIIDILVSDCIETSRKKLLTFDNLTPASISAMPDNLITLSDRSEKMLAELEKFLLENLYRCPQLISAQSRITEDLSSAFDIITRDPSVMPAYFRNFIDSQGLGRAACDYIAGMTDSYCLRFLEKHS